MNQDPLFSLGSADRLLVYTFLVRLLCSPTLSGRSAKEGRRSRCAVRYIAVNCVSNSGSVRLILQQIRDYKNDVIVIGNFMVVSVTQNPLFRVLDGQGRDFASNPPAPMPEIIGPKTGQPRSSEQSAIENGFRSTSDMQCRMAEVTVGTHSQSAAFCRWYIPMNLRAASRLWLNLSTEFLPPRPSKRSSRELSRSLRAISKSSIV